MTLKREKLQKGHNRDRYLVNSSKVLIDIYDLFVIIPILISLHNFSIIKGFFRKYRCLISPSVLSFTRRALR